MVWRLWSSVCFNPQFAVFEIGEFSLLVVELNLTSLSNGQIRRDSNAFSPEKVPESSVSQDFHSVAPSVEFHNQRPWLITALSGGTDPMRSLYVGVVPGSRGAALIQHINDHVSVRSVVVSCQFPSTPRKLRLHLRETMSVEFSSCSSRSSRCLMLSLSSCSC